MFPVTHCVAAIGAARAGERLFPPRSLPLDYRFAALGGLLPDLIDKPIAWYLAPSLGDDHIWAHSVWLPILLILAGTLVINRLRDARLFLLGLGALTHLLIDPVGSDVHKLFWPLFGTSISHARGYLFPTPVSGILIDFAIIAIILILPHLSYPFQRRLSAFAVSGTV